MAARGTTSGTCLAACALLCSVGVTATHAQRSANERRLDAPVGALQPRTLAEPDVAFAGGQFLVVWTEQRLSSDAQLLNQLFAARVTPDGRVLDPRGIAVASAAGLRREPRVVASGDGFVVLWRESRTAGLETARAARVDASGRVLDPEGVELPFYVGELGCAGGHCLAASSPGYEARVVGVDVCGTQGEENLLLVPLRTSSQSGATTTAARIVSTGCGHALAFGQHDEQSGEVSIALAGFELDGQPRFARTVQSVQTGGSTLPAFDLAPGVDGDLLLVWQQAGTARDELWSRWLDREGEARSEPTRVTDDGANPSLAFDGGGYLLVSGDDEFEAYRLDEDGKPVRSRPSPIRSQSPGFRDHVRVAAGPEGALVVWRPASTPLFGERNAAVLDHNGFARDQAGLVVAASANRQSAPQLVRDGDGYALLFRDDRPDDPGLRIWRLDAQGNPVGSATRVQVDQVDESAVVQLQAAGDLLALVSAGGDASWLSWLDPDTREPGAAVRPLAADGSELSERLVAGDGAILALVSGRGQLCGEDQACDLTLSLVMLDAEGRAFTTPPATRYGPDGEWTRTDARAAYDGHGFVVAFTQFRVESSMREASVRVVHVEPDGGVTGEPKVAASASENAIDVCAAIATAEDGYLLVLERSGTGGDPLFDGLFGVRLSPELVPLDDAPFPLATGEAQHAHVSAVRDGDAWLVAWQERAGEGSWDLRGARVPLTPGPPIALFGIAVSPGDELNPTLAAIGPGRALIAYERIDDASTAMVGRVFLRDLLDDASCDDPDCCDDECRAPAAARCDAMVKIDSCSADETLARRARYDCGCDLATRRAAPSMKAVLALLAFTLFAPRRRRRQRTGRYRCP